MVNDPQRSTASDQVLTEMARHIEPARMQVLVATGTHRMAAEPRQAFERRLRTCCPVGSITWHDCRQSDLVTVGGRWNAHPMLLSGRPVLAIGSVEPHYFAGFTGAHKTCTIGVSSYEDTQANHRHALAPASRPCRLEGNPIYDGITEMVSALEAAVDLVVVNLVQVGRQVVAATGGRCLESLRRATPLAQETYVRCIPAPADALILDVTGPLGQSFYQADKAIKNSELAVRDGGVMVLITNCASGVGQDDFVQILRLAPSYSSAVEAVDHRGYRLGDHKAVKLRYLTDRRAVRVYVVSAGLTKEDVAVLGLRKADTVEAALTDAGIEPGRDKVYRLEDAGNLCVLVNGG